MQVLTNKQRERKNMIETSSFHKSNEKNKWNSFFIYSSNFVKYIKLQTRLSHYTIDHNLKIEVFYQETNMLKTSRCIMGNFKMMIIIVSRLERNSKVILHSIGQR